MSQYNGWKNYKTWNVALWINNDESFHGFAKACSRALHPYGCFVSDLRDMECFETPDGIAWSDSEIDRDAINKLITELETPAGVK